ncbi:MAG: efflux RND transporter permease subunit [Pirellulales bacterium]|nr:efflux RND transporter permease subunit [Pirellulales bacterium]
MQIADFSIHNPVKVAVGVVLVCLFGIVAMLNIPVQLTPEVTRPVISVRTRWAGASPEEVEKEIVSKQEQQLQDVEGMIDFRSTCQEGQGEVEMEFEVGTDIDAALVRVTKRLSQVRDYPDDADEPFVRTVSANGSPIAWFSLLPVAPTHAEVRALLEANPHLAEPLAPLLARESIHVPMLYELAKHHPEVQELIRHDVDPSRLRTFAEDNIAARLQRAHDGVAASDVYGGREFELRVIFDPVRLAARKITVPQLRDALLRENRNVSGGDVWEGKRRYLVRTLGLFSDPQQVADTIVAYRDGAPVYVRDLATVELASTKPDSLGRERGVNMLSVNVQRKQGANVMDVMAAVREEVRSLNEGFLGRNGLQLVQTYDETVYISSAMSLVTDNLVAGSVLTALVLLVFMRSGRSTLVICLAIPICAMGTFVVIRLLGRSMNVISLAGMAFAVGVVVDSATVVLENIYVRYQRGESAFTAASRGTSEVWGAVLAGTLTMLAVFLPVIFIQAEAGQLFRDISIAISAGVAISLLVTLTVVPSAACHLLQHGEVARNREEDRSLGTRLWRVLDRWMTPFSYLGERFTTALLWATDRLQSGNLSHGTMIVTWLLFAAGAIMLVPSRYVQLEHWPWYYPVPSLLGLTIAVVSTLLFLPLAFRSRRVAVAIMSIVLGMGISYRLMPEAEYLPAGNKNLVYGRMQPPPGYNVDQLVGLARQVEDRLRANWEALPNSAEAARLEGPPLATLSVTARGRTLVVAARSADPERASEMVPLVRRAIAKLPGVLTSVSQTSLFERGLSGGRTIDIEISGPKLATLVGLGQEIMSGVQRILPAETTETSVQPIPGLDLGSPELHVRVRPEKAAQRGISTSDLGYSIDALVDGAYAGPYWHEQKEIELVLYGQAAFSERTQNVEQLPIATPTGEVISVADVADVRLASGPEQISRIDRERAITIQVRPGTGVALEGAMNRIQREVLDPIRAAGLPPGYHLNVAGTADDLIQMRTAMSGSLLFALLITYLLIAGLYESFLYPLVIMISVPMGAVGGFLGLWLLNLVTVQRLDSLTMLGFVILIGTVVNNAILIVDQTLVYIRRDGAHHRDAVRESVRGRVRPIFITTLTTLIGLFPLVVSPGAGSELYRGMGTVLFGGLVVSTFFTLLLVPLLFSLFFEMRARLFGRGISASSLAAVAALSGGDDETVTVIPTRNEDTAVVETL